MEFEICGIVRESESKRPVSGLFVRVFDKDLLFADLLGNAITAADGTFSIHYEGSDFRELFEKRPDIFLNIYGCQAIEDADCSMNTPLYTTRRHVTFAAGHSDYFVLEIPRERLGENLPKNDSAPKPQPGEWKGLIEDFIKGKPIPPQD